MLREMIFGKYSNRMLYNAVCSCQRTFHFSRVLKVTHYEVLNVSRNCSQREIRNAYLKLCKKYHPDLNKSDETLHRKFLRINEAYGVLSKPESRRCYDCAIAYLDHRESYRGYMGEEIHRSWSDPSFYQNRKERLRREHFAKYGDSDSNYYGIEGVKRVSNATILVILICVSLVSGAIQIFAIKQAIQRSERSRIEKGNEKILDKVRENAKSKTQDEILDELEQLYYENLNKHVHTYDDDDHYNNKYT